MKIKGASDLIGRLQGLKREVRLAVVRTQRTVGAKVLRDLKERTNLPFQTFVTHVKEHEFNPNIGAKVYAPKVQGIYASELSAGSKRIPSERRAAIRSALTASRALTFKLEGALGKAAKYPIGAHRLHDLLQASDVIERDGQILIQIGYPEGTGSPGSDTEYIAQVLFGTEKMLPRPLLNLGIEDNSSLYYDTLTAELREIFDRPGPDGGGRKIAQFFPKFEFTPIFGEPED